MKTDTPTIRDTPWMDYAELSQYLGLSTSYLRQVSAEGRGPPMIRFGRRCRFHKDEIDNWARQQHCGSVDQP